MRRFLSIIFIISITLSTPLFLAGQNSLKLRVSGNSTRFMNEPQGKEVIYPEVQLLNDSLTAQYGPVSNFTHLAGTGFDAELMTDLSDKIWLGFEISSDVMTGKNDYPGFYNFQFTKELQLQSTNPVDSVPTTYITSLPLRYRTSLINFIGNIRFYIAPDGRFRPFIKGCAGLSLVATELSLRNPSEWMTDSTLNYGPAVLYSRGTSSAPKGRVPAFTIGGGIGFEYQLTSKIAIYADGTYKMVNSDILDGKPNYDYNDKTGLLTHFTTWSGTSKFSVGLVYTIGDTFAILGKHQGGRSGNERTKKQHPFLPFYELKPR